MEPRNRKNTDLPDRPCVDDALTECKLPCTDFVEKSGVQMTDLRFGMVYS
jgi:hypothetical protein